MLAGLALVTASLLLGRTDHSVFETSSGSWGGFLRGIGAARLIAGAVLQIAKLNRTTAVRRTKDIGMKKLSIVIA